MTTNSEPSCYVTSTPNPSNAGSIMCSDVSSLSGTGTPSSSSKSSLASTIVVKSAKISEALCNLSLSEETGCTAGTDQSFVKKQSKKADTRDRQAFMSTDEQSCYYRVTADEENVEDVAYHWINLYRRDKKESMVFIIQFFVDVATYQTFDVSKFYKENGSNIKDIIKYMEKEENCPDVIINHNYLLTTKSNWSMKTQSAIYGFIDKFVKLSDTHHFITETIFPELFRFIKLMAFSEVRALKHTGVILALKFAVACAEILQETENEKKIQQEAFISTRKKSHHVKKFLEKYVEKTDLITQLLKSLYSTILKNCCVRDSKLDNMRILCAEEMCKLIIMHPTIFLKETSISVLLEYVIDVHKNIRISALQTFKKLVKIDNFSKHLEVPITKILRTIGKIIFDIEYNVAVLAVDVLTYSIRIYRSKITKQTIENVCRMVYNKHYPLAAAAGNFLITYLRSSQCDDDSTETVIKSIIKFSHMPDMGQLIPLLVESLVDCTPELQAYEAIINILLRDDILNFVDQVILLEILSNTVIQVITGTAKLLRNNYRKGEIDLYKNKMVMCKFIPALISLIQMYKDDERSLKNLLEMVLVFDYNDPILLKYREQMLDILKLISVLFLKINCKDILEMIVKVLVININTLCPLRNQASYRLKAIMEHILNKFEQYIDHISSDWSEEDVTCFETILLKISVIYKCYNMPFEWSFGIISSLPSNIQKANENILVHDLECGRHHLVWQLKILLEEDNEENITEETMDQFNGKLDEYLDICFKYLKAAQLHLVKTKAFECICDLHADIESELEGPIKINAKLEKLKLSIKDKDHKSCMIDFLNKNVFKFSVPNSYGNKMLAKFLQAVLNRMLPLTVLEKILRYYDKFFTKYEHLFDQTLKQLRIIDATLSITVILSTLFSEFNKLNDLNDVASFESMDLKKLVVRFSLFVAYEHITRILEMGITFAVTDEGTLPFLSFIQLFCSRLRVREKDHILNYLNENSKENFADSKYVKEFVSRLKVKKVINKYVKLPVGEESETSEPVSSQYATTTATNTLVNEDNTTIEEYSD